MVKNLSGGCMKYFFLNNRCLYYFFIFIVFSHISVSENNHIIRFDFESGDLQNWQIIEGEFGEFVCDRGRFHNQPDRPYNKEGRYFLSTLELPNGKPNDAMTGIIESPVFIPTGDTASFLVGGGSRPDTYVALCDLSGKELLKAQGKNTEVMQRIRWNVHEYIGQKVYLKIVDHNTGGWGHITFDDFQVEGYIDSKATKNRDLQRERLEREKEVTQIQRILIDDIPKLRAAVQELITTFGERYSEGERYLTELEEIESLVRTGGKGKTACGQPLITTRSRAGFALPLPPREESKQLKTLKKQFTQLKHKALIDNPLVSRTPILYVVRPQYKPDHHSTATMFQNGEINTDSFEGGAALKTIHLGLGNVTQTLVDVPDGIVRDPEISFDGMRILFSMRKNKSDDYHIYEYDLYGTGLRQLSYGSHISDIDPMFLPNGQIVFVSTREPKYCQCNRHIMGNLFKMDANGAHIHQIGGNTLFEGHPSIMPDGRILYDRWEYVDKHFGPAFGLWTVNPDGTNHAVFYGNNAWSPGAIMDARIVPNTQHVIAMFGSCHDRPWGGIAIVDRQRGLEGTSPILHSWPADIEQYLPNRRDYGQGTSRHHPVGGQIDEFKKLTTKYEDPYPLSDKYFLCSRTIEGERTGIFLIDIFGNEILLHAEGQGCFDPMPLTPIPRPPIIVDRTNFAKNEGFFYVANVYKGSGMESVEKGTIKSLRIVEAPIKLFWTHTNWNLDATQAPAMNFNCTNNKRIIGTVPVEKDGSAYFSVPSDMFVFFQLLDENGMIVQSMRSGTMIQPGETIGCVGCHENRLTTIENKGYPIALRRSFSKPEPWYGSSRDFNYLTEVQPVFDKHCVRCHDYGKPAGEKLNLSGDLGLVFNTSYLELRTKSALRWFPSPPGAEKLLVKAVDDGPPEVLPPYSWGSHQSRLVDIIRSGHQNIELDQESMDRIITWIDLNAPYYGSYASVYRDNVFGRSPLNNQEIEQLRQLTGLQIGDISSELQGSQVNFNRPELSICLNHLEKSSDAYKKALDIIHKGKKRLEQKPRMDMPGAQITGIDLEKQHKYNDYLNTEQEVRKAILETPKLKQVFHLEY